MLFLPAWIFACAQWRIGYPYVQAAIGYRKLIMNRGVIKILRVSLGLLMLGCSPALQAWDAKLPQLIGVPATQSTAIDGVWRLATNKARIRIEAGRAYALDPWVYLLLWQVKPQMVVMRNFREAAIGRFDADDLLLAGPATLTLINPDQLRVEVRGALAPVTYKLQLVEAADSSALKHLWSSLSAVSASFSAGSSMLPTDSSDNAASPSTEHSSAPSPVQPSHEVTIVPQAPMQNCEKTATDPDSGLTICL